MQWVGEADWIYRCEFEVERLPESRSKDGEDDEERADLVFEGLDTFATVFRELPCTRTRERTTADAGANRQ